jgi:phage tail-like protein
VTVPFTTFRFEVVLNLDSPLDGVSDPVCDAAFSECSGLEMSMEPKTIAVGGINDHQVHLIGPVKSAQLSLKRGMTADLSLWNWVAAISQSTAATASGTITMWASDSTPVVEFSLTGCLPVRLRAPSLNAQNGVVAIEELSLVYQTLTVAPAGGGGFGVSLGASVGVGLSASASVGVSVSGGVSL